MNVVIMCHVDHKSTEMEGENQQIVPKNTTRNTNQAYPKINVSDVKDYCMIWVDFFSCGQKKLLHKMAEIKRSGIPHFPPFGIVSLT